MIHVHSVKEEFLIVILRHIIVWVWQAYCERRESAPERRTALYKSGQQQPSRGTAVTGGMYMGVASLLSDHRVVLRWLVECIWVWQACYLTITWYCGDWWNVYGCGKPAVWPSCGTAVTGGLYMGVTSLTGEWMPCASFDSSAGYLSAPLEVRHYCVQVWRFCSGLKILFKLEGSVQVWMFCSSLKVLFKFEGSVFVWRFCWSLKLLFKFESSIQVWRFGSSLKV